MQPLFLDRSLFDSMSGWTEFEKDLFNLLTRSEASKGLLFSKRLKIVDEMRAGGIKALQEIEEGRVVG